MYRVLVVDDESIERKGIISLIKKYKYPMMTFEAENGKKALDIIDKQDIHILITDIRMPIMDGIELIEHIRKKDKDIIIIINSAYSEFQYAKTAVKMQVFNYILKPINVKEFHSVMSEVIHHYKKNKKTKKKNKEILQNKVLLYEKNNVLFDLLNKSVVTDRLRERAVELGFNNCIFYLVLMDTNNRFLEDHHRFFSSIIEEDFSGTCFYLNINEYQSVVIIKSDKILSKKTLINTGEKLIEKTKKVYLKDLFLIFSNPIVKIDDLYEEYISLEELLDYKFFYR